MTRVRRLLLAFVSALFSSALVLGLLLWWLSRRQAREQEPAAIEIRIPPAAPDAELPLPGSAASSPMARREAEAEGKPPPSEQKAGPDDLKRIEGIGPKISSVLQAAGIGTFEQLAAAEVSQIEQILEAEDPRLRRLADPGTWPEQARLAADGDWAGLAALQQQLKGGRRMGPG